MTIDKELLTKILEFDYGQAFEVVQQFVVDSGSNDHNAFRTKWTGGARLTQFPFEYANLLCRMNKNPSETYLAIGTAWGYGSIMEAEACGAKDIIFIDIEDGYYAPKGHLKELYDEYRTLTGKNIIFLSEDSTIALPALDLPKEYFGNIFIDGNHQYQGVKTDFENCRPLLKPNGLIFFHDTILPAGGVKELWKEIKNERCEEYLAPNTFTGIGVWHE